MTGRDRNVRYAWLLLTYGLAADIIYRASLGAQRFGQIVDLVALWVGVELFYAITEMRAAGSIIAAFRVSTIPTMALTIIVGAGALLAASVWGAWAVAALAAGVAVLAVLAMILARARQRV